MVINKLIKYTDNRGTLISLSSSQTIPFDIKRVFYMYGMPYELTRGNHAHFISNQYLVCVSGSAKLITNDITGEKSYYLNDPATGVFIPKMTWTSISEFKNSVVIVFTDTYYDESDYIRSFDLFMKLIGKV